MDMKRKIVRRIVLITMLALFMLSLVVIGVGYYTSYKAAENNIENISSVYESMIRNMSYEEIIMRFSDSDEDIARITISDIKGHIVVDNMGNNGAINNIYNSKEFASALDGNREKVLYYDTKLNEIWMYNMFRVEHPEFEGGAFVMSVGFLYESDVDRLYLSLPVIIGAVLVVTFLATVLTNKLIKTAVTPFEKIQESLEEINRGDYHQVTLNTKYEDINRVVREINDVSAKISNSINYLNYEQRKNEFLLQNMQQGVLAISKKGKIILANDAIKRIFRFDKNILGCEMTYLSDDEILLGNISKALDNKENSTFEASVNDGIYRVDIAQVEETWFEEFRGIAIIVLFTDITEEANSNRIRSEFFANASHELKTPLTAIKGYSELMTAIDDKNTRTKCIDEINKNANRMLSLIQDMLKLSKLDAKIIDEEKVTVDLREEADEIVGNLMPLAYNRGITINVSGQGKISGWHKLIDEMITNIVGNSIKYNKDNGKIDVTIEETSDEVIFTVSDTGIGIPKKDQARIFERFYIPDKGRNKKVMSTGLGLAIVKHIVIQHNARIELVSAEGEGTKISVIFKKTEN